MAKTSIDTNYISLKILSTRSARGMNALIIVRSGVDRPTNFVVPGGNAVSYWA